jgi:hypothetical protein
MRMMRGFPWTPEQAAMLSGQNSGQARPRRQDPADMGTAFGLEAILAAEAEQAGYDPQRACGAEGRAAGDLPHGMDDRLNRRSVI